MAAVARVKEVVTAKDVIEFGQDVYQRLKLYGCPHSDFPDEFGDRFQEVGQIIREEAVASGQEVSRNTILGTRSRLAFRDLKLWTFGQGVYV